MLWSVLSKKAFNQYLVKEKSWFQGPLELVKRFYFKPGVHIIAGTDRITDKLAQLNPNDY